jgi:hypothetical protein
MKRDPCRASRLGPWTVRGRVGPTQWKRVFAQLPRRKAEHCGASGRVYYTDEKGDGVAMNPETLAAFSKAGHWGLVGMKERASRIGARLECQSSLGFGTKLTVLVPGTRAYENSFGLRQWLPAWCR